MGVKRVVPALCALTIVLWAFVGAAFAPSAGAIGAEIYRTDSEGRKTGTVIGIGNTGTSAFCARTGIGAIHLGVAVCYLPL